MKRYISVSLACILAVFAFALISNDSASAQTSVSAINVRSVGVDLSTNSSPTSVGFRVDTSAQSTSNPSTFSGLSVGAHTSYATYVPGYTISVGSCSYVTGGTECAVVNFAAATCDANFNICSESVTTVANNTTKVVWAYTSGTNSSPNNMHIYRIGSDQTTATAPAGAQVRLGLVGSFSSSNPATYSTTTGLSMPIQATYVPGYNLHYSYCSYVNGAAECFDPAISFNSFSTTTSGEASGYCNVVTNICTQNITSASAGEIKKIFFRYTPVTTGTVQFYRTGPDQTIASVPGGTQIRLGTSGAFTTTNPLTTVTSNTSVTMQVNYIQGYDVSVWCTNDSGPTACCWSIDAPFMCGAYFYDPFIYNTYIPLTTTTSGEASGYCNTVTNLCTLTVEVLSSASENRKVYIRYTPTNLGSLQVYRVGVDQTISTAPAGGQVRLGTSGSFSSSNPTSFATTSGTVPVQATYIPGYDLHYSYCIYLSGAPECSDMSISFNSFLTTTSGEASGYCNTVTNICTQNISVPSTVGEIKKVVFRYTQAGTYTPDGNADILVKRVGTDLYAASAPAGTQVALNGSSFTSTNPNTYSNQSATSTHIIYGTYSSSYVITVGTCTFQKGTAECAVTNFVAATCDANTGRCAYSTTATANNVRKVVWKYDPISSGDIMIKRVGEDLYTSSSPAGVLSSVDTETMESTNPRTWTTTVGTHSTYVTYNSGYTAAYGTCTYPRNGTECAVTTFTNTTTGSGSGMCDAGTARCRYDVPVTSAVVTKVAWRFIANNSLNPDFTTDSGDIQVKRVGSDLYASSAPAGTTMKVDTLTAVSTNPYTYLNLTVGSNNHTVYATYLPGSYVTEMGSCTYDRGGTECAVTSFSTVTCDANTGLCAATYTVSADSVRKVVARYTTVEANSYGDIQTKRVGTDLYASSAPAGTQNAVDSQSMTSTNPYTWPPVSSGTHSTYSTYNASYSISVGTCTYPRNGNECAVTSFTNVPVGVGNTKCDPNTGRCRHDVSVTSAEVTKVVWKYDAAGVNEGTTNAKVYRVGADQTTATAPAGTQVKLTSAGTLTSTNPATYTTTSGSKSFYTTYVAGYEINARYCTYTQGNVECATLTNAGTPSNTVGTTDANNRCNTSTSLCRTDINVPAGSTILKVVWRYTPNNTGDVAIYRVGIDQTTATAPAGTQARHGLTGSLSSTNPLVMSTSTNGVSVSQTFYTTYVPGYDVQVLRCNYPRGGVECTDLTNLDSSLDLGTTDASGICNTVTNLCRITTPNNVAVFFVDQVLKIVWRYTPTGSGDVAMYRVGADQTTASAPAGTQARHGLSGSFGSANPLLISTSTSVTHSQSFYTTYVPGYDVQALYCTYPQGGVECSNLTNLDTTLSIGTTDASGVCNTLTNLCRITTPNNVAVLQVDRVLKVVWRYTLTGTRDFEMHRVGSDQTAATAPAGTQVRFGTTGTLTSTNPATFASTTGTKILYATYVPGYTLTVHSCVYPRGGVECVANTNEGTPTGTIGTTDVDNRCNTVTNLCRADVASAPNDNEIKKVVWRYTVAGTYTPDGTADLIVKRVGSDLYAASAPAGTSITYNSNATTTTNPVSYPNQSTTTPYTITATYSPSYNISVGACSAQMGLAECSVTSFTAATCSTVTNLCTYSATLTNNHTTKVVWKYDSFGTGDIMVKRVGTDLYAASAPAGTAMRVDTLTIPSTNPAIYSSLQTGTNNHTVYATYLPGSYVTTFGTCTYERGGNECAVTTFAAATCDTNTGFCSKVYSVGSEDVVKVVAKYDEVTSVPYTFTNEGDKTVAKGGSVTNVLTATKKTTAEAQTITFSAGTLPSGVTASFSPTSCTTTCETTLTLTAATGMTDGRYPVTIIASPQQVVTSFVLDVSGTAGAASSINVKRVGSDETTTTAPAGTQTKVDSSAVTSVNPYTFSNLSTGSHTVYTTAGSPISAGKCSYASSGTGCTVSLFDLTPTCDATWCSITFSISASTATKVVFKYGSAAASVNCSVSSAAAPTGSTLTWSASVPESGTYTYNWTGTDGLSGFSSLVQKQYTTRGTKTATVTVSQNGVEIGQCTKSANITASSFIEH